MRADFEKGLIDKQQARALLGYSVSGDEAFAGQFHGTKTEAPESELSQSQISEIKMLISRQWVESEHPRDENGRFTTASAHHTDPIDNEDLPVLNEAQAQRDLEIVHSGLSRIFPHLKSRWKGQLEVSSIKKLEAWGIKSWECSIIVAREAFTEPATWICTVIHEGLHAYSPSTARQYEAGKLWEEAVIEHVVRLHRRRISRLFLHNITEDDFERRDRRTGYKKPVQAIEAMRLALGEFGADKNAFYEELQAIPAHRIEQTIVDKASGLSPSARRHFENVYQGQQRVFKRK
ncbi:MAG: hypothetical protein EOP06_19060 [Proteobacteria bacterium]|nr:MAG: hypothetical protein EOP06_19060 [Pseudomonadota bacterium]